MGLKVSVVICSLDRPDSLRRCLESLNEQTYSNFEVKIVREKGELAALRNKGARDADGDIISFIDDDVILTPAWMENVVGSFGRDQRVGGVSGPAIIPKEYRKNRDIFRWSFIKYVYDFLFLDGKQKLPGHITKAGTWTTGACEENCIYEGVVHFLEACNMSWRKEAFQEVGGFDEAYRGIGDWSEPDLAFRVRERGWKLWFSPRAALYHLPDRTGAYLSRATTGARHSNYLRFSKRWVKPCVRNELYKLFLRGYFQWRELGAPARRT